jgi:hypothetical protein
MGTQRWFDIYTSIGSKEERETIRLKRCKPPAEDIVRVQEPLIRKTVTAIYEKMDVPPEDAAEGVDVLVMTERCGLSSSLHHIGNGQIDRQRHVAV